MTEEIKIIITPKLINHVATIFGWMWLVSYYIIRYRYLERWFFVVCVVSFFAQAVFKIQELIVNNGNMDPVLWGYQIVNWFWMLSFVVYVDKIVKCKDKNHEKNTDTLP